MRSEAPSADTAGRDRSWVLPWLVAAATALAFWPALRGGFVWDDEVLLAGNRAFRGFGAEQLAWMFGAPRFAQYHPLTWLSFAADFQLHGMDPRGFHLTSVLLHAANAFLLFWLARRLLALASGAETWETRSAAAWGAAFAALAFALSPLRVESVAWLTERRGLLSAFFMLGSTLAYVEGCRADPRRCAAGWLALSLDLFALALLSKAVAVTLPAALLVLDWHPLRRPMSERRVWLEKLPYLVLAAPFAVLAPIAQVRGGAAEPFATYGAAARLGQAVYGAAFYAWKALVPWPLLPLYRFPDAGTALALKIAAAGAAVAGLTWLAASSVRRRPAFAAAWGAHLILLSPVLGFFQSGPHYVAERYTYLPCMAWAVLSGAAFMALVRERANRLAVFAFAAAYLMCLVALTRREIPVWRDPVALWSRVAAADPKAALAQNNLCSALRDAGRASEALEHCRAALGAAPAYEKAHCNLASLLADAGRLPEAVAQYQAALGLDPADPVAHNGLGHALYRQGRLGPARAEFEAALRLAPDYALAHGNLGAALSDAGLPAEARREFDAALALEPADADAHFNMGNLHLAARRLDEAAREYREAVRLRPGHARAHVNLGMLLSGQGRLEEAAAEYRAALAAEPGFADAYNDLGIVLFRQGRREEAIKSFQRALDLNPAYADARYNIARARHLSH